MLSRALFGGDWTGPLVLLALLLVLAAAELWRPLHAHGAEPGGRVPANIAFGLINAGLGLALPLSSVLAAEWAAGRGIGLLHLAPMPWIVAAAATVAIRSLATYLVHMASHESAWLWRIHRVHHTDTLLDLSTGLRNHPLELAFVAPWLAAVAIAFGLDPATLLAYEAVALVFAFWDHANLGLPPWLDRLLRLLVVTPAMHHVHHSARQAETDSNYGDVLSLWDRLFGTYRALDRDALRAMRIGLGDAYDTGASSLVRQLGLPLRTPAAPSEARQEGGEVGAERVDGIAALHHHQSGQA